MSRFESIPGLFLDGPRNFEPRSDEEDDTDQGPALQASTSRHQKDVWPTTSSADPLKEASSNSVIALEISGSDTVHFRRAPSFSRIPISPPLPLILFLFYSWNWSSDMTETQMRFYCWCIYLLETLNIMSGCMFAISSRSRTNNGNEREYSTTFKVTVEGRIFFSVTANSLKFAEGTLNTT
ncbi:hypothetical protein AVEN_76659-1 [Araneus ventricosus]|uniref:Uncharacterized protein n=1 Tax=Araneus ventricosus TaxID=182803 RepID=A0A4Y2BPQ7_ARAVE|nr:hypothetical protein AVEN_76659-1 [Araneus ventricosus]